VCLEVSTEHPSIAQSDWDGLSSAVLYRRDLRPSTISFMQKCTTCHRTQSQDNFAKRAGKVGKTCQKCLGKKKRKAADAQLADSKLVAAAQHELDQQTLLVQALIAHNVQLLKSNSDLRKRISWPISHKWVSRSEGPDIDDVTSVLDFMTANPHGRDPVLDDSPKLEVDVKDLDVDRPGSPLRSENSSGPQQQCSTCHRSFAVTHFNGKKTCPACLTRKKRRATQHTDEAQMQERALRLKLRAIRAKLNPLLAQNQYLIHTNRKTQRTLPCP